MQGAIIKRLKTLQERPSPEEYIKNKKEQVKINTRTVERQRKDYVFCLCDYCLEEILINRFDGKKKVKPKWGEEEKAGGVITLKPHTTELNTDIVLALHNKCLNPAIEEIKTRSGIIK